MGTLTRLVRVNRAEALRELGSQGSAGSNSGAVYEPQESDISAEILAESTVE